MMRRRLNLVRPDGDFDIQYKVSRFPDGQQGITIQEVYDPEEPHEIISRLNSFSDLELILCANYRAGLKTIRVLLPGQVYTKTLEDLAKDPMVKEIVLIPVRSHEYITIAAK